MLARGLEHARVGTGGADNASVRRKSATSERTSQRDRPTAEILETAPEVAPAADGRPLLTRELDLIINLDKRGSNSMGNVTVRGTSAKGLELRPNVRITQGRMFNFGSHDIVVGSNIAKRFKGVEMGATVPFGGANWTVVGYFDAGGSGVDSEIWADAEQVMQAFNRPVDSAVTLRLKDT